MSVLTLTGKRLVRGLSWLALLLVSLCLLVWWQMPEGVPQLLKQAAYGAVAIAVVAMIVNTNTRPRLMLRFLSALSMLIAAIVIAADWTRPPDAPPGATSLLDHLTALTPSIVASLQAGISSRLSPTIWDPVLTTLLGLPAWFIFTAVAVGLAYAGRPRRDVRIFIN